MALFRKSHLADPTAPAPEDGKTPATEADGAPEGDKPAGDKAPPPPAEPPKPAPTEPPAPLPPAPPPPPPTPDEPKKGDPDSPVPTSPEPGGRVPPDGKLPPADSDPSGGQQPKAPNEPPPDDEKEGLHEAFVGQLRSLQQFCRALRKEKGPYGAVANEAHMWLAGFLPKVDSIRQPGGGAGADAPANGQGWLF